MNRHLSFKMNLRSFFTKSLIMTSNNNIFCPEKIISGASITKDKRIEIFGKSSGGAETTVHERFTRKAIEEGTGIPCPKSNVRINLRTSTLKSIAHPNKHDDGFDYTEDFDGVQNYNGKTIYVNLKCVVGKGGAQTRSLREVYNMVEGQLNVLASTQTTFFANILDGDEAASTMPKFKYLLSLPEYKDVCSKVYVGDTKGYFEWFKQTVCG